MPPYVGGMKIISEKQRRITCTAHTHTHRQTDRQRKGQRETEKQTGIVRGAGSMKQYGVRPSVRKSVCPSTDPQQQTRCCRFAAVGPAGTRYRSTDCCSGGRMRAVPRCQRSPLHYYYYFLTPVLNSRGMKKLRYAIQKSTKIQLE